MYTKKPQWIIPSETSVFNLQLKYFKAYRYLLYQLVRRDIVSFYRQTVLGPLWFFVQPILTTLIFSFAFGKLAKISTDGLPQPLFYLSGIIVWNYFTECLNRTSTVLKDNIKIFSKVYFPRIIVPISITLSLLVRFLIQFSLFICIILFFSIQDFHFSFNWTIALFPFLILMIATLGLGIGLSIASLTARYRDLSFLVTFGLQLMMYTTTIIYPLSAAPDHLRVWIQINPMTTIIETFRYIFLHKGNLSWLALGYCVIMNTSILFIGMFLFKKIDKSFADLI